MRAFGPAWAVGAGARLCHASSSGAMCRGNGRQTNSSQEPNTRLAQDGNGMEMGSGMGCQKDRFATVFLVVDATLSVPN